MNILQKLMIFQLIENVGNSQNVCIEDNQINQIKGKSIYYFRIFFWNHKKDLACNKVTEN